MPIVRVEMLRGRTEEQKAALASAITQAMQAHAGAKPDSVFVVFEDVEPANWAIAGRLLSRPAPDGRGT